MGPNQTSFCTANETIKNNKKTIYAMGENIWKYCNWQGLNLQNIQATHITQQEKYKQSNQKLGRRP